MRILRRQLSVSEPQSVSQRAGGPRRNRNVLRRAPLPSRRQRAIVSQIAAATGCAWPTAVEDADTDDDAAVRALCGLCATSRFAELADLLSRPPSPPLRQAAAANDQKQSEGTRMGQTFGSTESRSRSAASAVVPQAALSQRNISHGHLPLSMLLFPGAKRQKRDESQPKPRA